MSHTPTADSSERALAQLVAGRYVVERELGRGGMGTVYLARETRLDRLVAIKVLPSEYAVVGTVRDRFLRESRLAAGFSHPNIVPVYGVEESDELLAYVMAFVEGETLAERVRRGGPLSVRETLRVLQDVGYALAFAHSRGVVHRDIKPENIMIERATGRALVMDFGIARPIASAPDTLGLTRVGEVVGTPEYMSPEQATGEHVDGRSDLYSLGLSVHFALTGSTIMTAESTGKIIVRQLTERIPPMRSSRPDIPAGLGDVIDRCLMKDPAHRFADAASLIATLDAAQLGEPEIPLGMRLFAQNLGTLSLFICVVLMLLYPLVGANLEAGNSVLDSIIPVVIIMSVFGARAVQVLSEARQLAVSGFSPGAIERGLQTVIDERAARRTELRTDAGAHRTRRRAIRLSVALIVLALIAFRSALAFRTQIGPRLYQTTLTGVVLFFAAFICLPVGVMLLVRSPFRMPIGERLFRFVWIGPIGRRVIRLATRGIPVFESTAASPKARVRPSPDPGDGKPVAVPPNALTPGRIHALEARIAALERWRDGLK